MGLSLSGHDVKQFMMEWQRTCEDKDINAIVLICECEATDDAVTLKLRTGHQLVDAMLLIRSINQAIGLINPIGRWVDQWISQSAN